MGLDYRTLVDYGTLGRAGHGLRTIGRAGPSPSKLRTLGREEHRLRTLGSAGHGLRTLGRVGHRLRIPRDRLQNPSRLRIPRKGKAWIKDPREGGA